MAYRATAISVMIASPGDVNKERELAREIIHEWNDVHSLTSSLVLLPVGWETHSSPDLGGRPQELINKQVLEKCDLLVGVFWTRIGTPTGEAESGTVEEIRKHVEAGKPAMVYFSTAPVAPESLDPEQYEQLTEFKNWCETQGLIEVYDDLSSFSEKFRRQIQIMVRDNEYLKSAVSATTNEDSLTNTSLDQINININTPLELSEEAKRILIEASKDASGTILSVRTMSGPSIQTNRINFIESYHRRSVARWEAALEQLVFHDLIVARGHKNEVFEITAKGFEAADALCNKNKS